MTSIDNRFGTNYIQMYIPAGDPDSETGQMIKETSDRIRQDIINDTSPLSSGLRVLTEEETAASTATSKIAAEGLRQQQKETPVYALYKLDGEVVGMYLKDAQAYTMFETSDIQSDAIQGAKARGLTFEDFDAYVSGKIEDSLKAEFGDRFEVETFGYSDDAPLAGDYSEQFFGEDSKFNDLQAMNSKLVMDPSWFAVMTERYQ